jgi:hypothetical protein
MKRQQNWAEHADLNLTNWTNNEEYMWEYEYEDESQYLTVDNFKEEELYEEDYIYEYTYEYTYNYTYVYNYKYSYH